MSLLLRQAVALAELPPAKGRALLRELGPFRDESIPRLLNHASLTPSERKRLEYLDSAKLEAALRLGVRWVEPAEYPALLSEWQESPPGLFAWGEWQSLRAQTIGIVGTRSASTYGKAVATKFAEAFARAGVTVVSGGAIGIDSAAHTGALAVSGRTVAVLGGGVDKPYPALNRGLFQRIREGGGCIVSQFACGTSPNDYKFLVRNFLIAALSRAVVVVEAPERSGSIHTANRLNELGRQVFVVPANIENLNFRGSHALIRDGATLVDHPDQVLHDLDIKPVATVVTESPTNGTAAKIIAALSTTPLAVEFILERTGLPMADVVGELTMLELEGRIIHDAGGYAIKP